MIDGGLLSRGEQYLFAAFSIALTLWAALSAFALINRLLFERRRRLNSAVSVVDVEQLLHDATLKRAWHKWTRISAFGKLTASYPDRAYDVLAGALRDVDADVSNAAAINLHRIGDQRAAAILIAALKVRTDSISPSRIAAHLDLFPTPIYNLLRPLLTDADPDRRYWAAALLARYPEVHGMAQDLASLADDDHPPVRKAAVSSLGELNPAVALPVATRLLVDVVPYVRSAALRAIGRLGSEEQNPSRRREVARLMTPLLADARWEVRLAAKESLMVLGPGIWRDVAAVLTSQDEFARQGAAEVLQNLNVVDWAVGVRAAHGVGASADLATTVTPSLRDCGLELGDTATLRDPDSIEESDRLIDRRKVAGFGDA